jgi:ribonuclease HI
MGAAIPHYLLFAESRHCQATAARGSRPRAGQWRFVLEAADSGRRFEAADEEPEMDQSRVELLAVVRGLEALSQPSRVTLVTPSRYVNRGLRFGLEPWREAGWRWERFGEMIPIRNEDLWRRLDRALRIHRVEFRTWRFDAAHAEPESAARVGRAAMAGRRRGRRRRVAHATPGLAARCARLVRDFLRRCTIRAPKAA